MKENNYNNLWLSFVNLKAKKGFVFKDLIDFEDTEEKINYKGVWANIIIKSKNIKEALDIIPLGLDELNFEVIFIDKIENIGSLIEYKEISNDDVKSEADWLLKNNFVFKISDRLFPYK